MWQHTHYIVERQCVTDAPASSSGKKLRYVLEQTQPETDDTQDLGYGLVDLNILKRFVEELPCISCYGSVRCDIKIQAGLAMSLIVTCTDTKCAHASSQTMSEYLQASKGEQEYSIVINLYVILLLT